MSETQLTDKQQAFVAWYIKLKNATRAAERAGYTGAPHTLEQSGYELLRNPEVRAEIDRLFSERLPSPQAVLDMLTVTATMDVTPYLREDGTLDIHAMGKDGLGNLVTGVKPGRNGMEVTLQNPQTAQKMLARYHRLLDRHLDVDVHTSTALEKADLDALAQQIAIAQRQASQQGDAQDDDV